MLISIRIENKYNAAMKKNVYKRLNITLPESTVLLLEAAADKGERSVFIDVAIKSYIKQIKQENLRERLKAGAIARSQRDLALSKEWFETEEDLWQK